jgi:hypothetical protein
MNRVLKLRREPGSPLAKPTDYILLVDGGQWLLGGGDREALADARNRDRRPPAPRNQVPGVCAWMPQIIIGDGIC